MCECEEEETMEGRKGGCHSSQCSTMVYQGTQDTLESYSILWLFGTCLGWLSRSETERASFFFSAFLQMQLRDLLVSNQTSSTRDMNPSYSNHFLLALSTGNDSPFIPIQVLFLHIPRHNRKPRSFVLVRLYDLISVLKSV
jgi:hypothetical protein